jgi:hypothetical protein
MYSRENTERRVVAAQLACTIGHSLRVLVLTWRVSICYRTVVFRM